MFPAWIRRCLPELDLDAFVELCIVRRDARNTTRLTDKGEALLIARFYFLPSTQVHDLLSPTEWYQPTLAFDPAMFARLQRHAVACVRYRMRSAQICDLYVHDAYTYRGLGTQLLERAQRDLRPYHTHTFAIAQRKHRFWKNQPSATWTHDPYHTVRARGFSVRIPPLPATL